MDNMLHIGAKLDKETSENAANAICQILDTAFQVRATDEVILAAFNTLKAAVTVNNVNIEGCTFDNDTSKTLHVSVPADYKLEA